MNVYKIRLLKKTSNRKLKLVLSTPVTTWLSNITFHLQLIWPQTLIAIDSEIRNQNHAWHCFQAFACRHLKSLRCFVQIWADALSLDRLLIQTRCFAHVALILCHIFTHRPRNDKFQIKGCYGCCLGLQQLLAVEISFHIKKKSDLLQLENLQSIRSLNWVSNSGTMPFCTWHIAQNLVRVVMCCTSPSDTLICKNRQFFFLLSCRAAAALGLRAEKKGNWPGQLISSGNRKYFSAQWIICISRF